MAYANGDKYFGEYARDVFEGFGTFQWAPYVEEQTGITVPSISLASLHLIILSSLFPPDPALTKSRLTR